MRWAEFNNGEPGRYKRKTGISRERDAISATKRENSSSLKASFLSKAIKKFNVR